MLIYRRQHCFKVIPIRNRELNFPDVVISINRRFVLAKDAYKNACGHQSFLSKTATLLKESFRGNYVGVVGVTEAGIVEINAMRWRKQGIQCPRNPQTEVNLAIKDVLDFAKSSLHSRVAEKEFFQFWRCCEREKHHLERVFFFPSFHFTIL